MYDELHEIWKRELEGKELEKLEPNFYSEVADYVRKLKEECRMLDKRTVKANLLRKELKNIKHMVNDLIQTRRRKLFTKMVKGERAPLDSLTSEEERIFTGVLPFAEAYSNLANEILRGHMAKVTINRRHKRTILRFLKETPSIVGADMKSYGPFKTDDVASLPVENAKIMVKQSLAEKVEVS